jgi:hypothetical protein
MKNLIDSCYHHRPCKNPRVKPREFRAINTVRETLTQGNSKSISHIRRHASFVLEFSAQQLDLSRAQCSDNDKCMHECLLQVGVCRLMRFRVEQWNRS